MRKRILAAIIILCLFIPSMAFAEADGLVYPLICDSNPNKITGNLTIKSADPSIIFDVDPNSGDTNWWQGVQSDANSDDNDKFQIGDGAEPGTNPFVTVLTNGYVGIGTVNPSFIFHTDTGAAHNYLKLETDDGYDATLVGYQATTLKFGIGYDDSVDLVRLTYGAFGANVGINIDSTNKIGLGTTSPSSMLDLEKSGTATGKLNILELTNSVNAASMTNTRHGILWNQWYYDANTPAVVDAANIIVGTEGNWTSTASTQDAYMAFSTVLDGTMIEHASLTSAGTWVLEGNNGAQLNLKKITEEVTIAVGSGADPVVASSTNLAPAGSLIMGVTFIVTDAPGGGATEIDIGRTNGGNLDEFIDGASCDVLGETGDNYTNGDTAHTGIQRSASADTFTLTTDSDVTGDEMKVRIIVWYRDITVPTS